jgi:aldose 1-epimerase
VAPHLSPAAPQRGSDRRRGVNPTGAQIEIRHDRHRACIVEVGGALRAYRFGDRDLVDGYPAGGLCTDARGQPLIPWPNRLRDGAYTFAGRRHQLPLTEPARRNAIHGLVRWANWIVAAQDDDHVAMAYTLHAQDGYPFALELEITYRLADAGLSVTTVATNVGATECPFGSGAHPYLTVGSGPVDAVRLRAPGRTRLIADEQGIPVDVATVEGTAYDFRRARRIGATVLDTAYADLERAPDGLARVAIAMPGGETATLWLDASYPFLMLFTGDTLPDAARRRRSLGVEPMTCAPNAFQSGDGLRTLAPGESISCAWGITPGTDRSPARLP